MILSGATTRGQNGPASNGNKEVIHIPPKSKAEASLLFNVVYRIIV